mmetsp:Transcript_36341/g.113316  ORF Transcript_36341/g.113316 Transcript_36341/m.113316 type:complete len:202 (+) Transcript_36341:1176-1781(+)
MWTMSCGFLLFFLLNAVPFTGGMLSGDGRKSMMASSRNCTPLFLNADPTRTHTLSAPPFNVSSRSAAFNSEDGMSSIDSFPSRYLDNTSSSNSPTCSIKVSLALCASRRTELGSSPQEEIASVAKSSSKSRYVKDLPSSSWSYSTTFMSIRSTIPTNEAHFPRGSCKIRGTHFIRSISPFTVMSRSAPSRSSLLTNTRRGT